MNSDEVIDKIAATAANVKWTDFSKVGSIFCRHVTLYIVELGTHF